MQSDGVQETVPLVAAEFALTEGVVPSGSVSLLSTAISTGVSSFVV